MMKFLIEIEGSTQPELIKSLDAARFQLLNGRCYLNVCGCTNAILKPADEESEETFRKLASLANPRPTTPWVRE